MPRAISKCPRCGQPVTPFAAGCAICGADLEAARAALAAKRRLDLPALPTRLTRGPGLARGGRGWFEARTGIDWVHIVVAILLALAASPFGLVLGLYWAIQRYRGGETVMALAMLAAAGLAAAALVAPVWFWSRLYGGL
jgi:hypothetical protein